MVAKMVSLKVVVEQGEAEGVALVVSGETPKVTRPWGVATPVVVVQTTMATSVAKQGVTMVTIDVVAVAEELMAALYVFTVVKLATL